MRAPTSLRRRRGMTLMEVVIAIGVVAFVVPLVLAVTAAVGKTRSRAEADTRSAWLAQHVRSQLLAGWAQPPQQSEIEPPVPFPTAGATPPPVVLIYDGEGRFVAVGDEADLRSPVAGPQAEFIVQVRVAPQPQALALVDLTLVHPAQAAPSSRRTFRYKFLTTREGSL